MSETASPVVLRHLSACEAPMPGVLVSGDRLRVRTDAALWEGNPAWSADAGGHVLAPLEAGRDADGCVVFVAHCPSRLMRLLEQRAQIDPGEAVTVAVSLLRGAAEAVALGIEMGAWWVTDDGRPVLAAGGSGDWCREAHDILSRVLDLTAGDAASAFAAAQRALDDPDRLARDLVGLEAALFSAADPSALTTEFVSLSARAMSVTSLVAAEQRPGAKRRPFAERRPARAADILYDFVSRHIDAQWAAQLTDAWQRVARLVTRIGAKAAVRSESDSVRRPRRLPLMLACAAGAVVLAVGLSWPEDARDEVAAAAPADAAPSPASRAHADPTPTGVDKKPDHDRSARAPASVDSGRAAASRAADLLDRLADCQDDACRAALVEDSAREFPDGPATDPDAVRAVRVIDEYGGVTALSVESHGQAQIVVLVRVDDKWLVRDIHDVADQP